MRKIALCCIVVLSVAVVAAQAPQGPPKPGPEHKKMQYFVGKWSGGGDSKESPFGPAGKFTFDQSCEWLPGGFHLMCSSSSTGPMGPMRAHAVMGYDAEEKVYTYYETDSTGMAALSKGTVNGNVWTWTNTMKMAGKTYKSRFILTEVPPNGQSFKWEMAEGNAPMKVLMEGKVTRAK